ncbi:MAG: fimbria/pilus periplasmic chaperone [Granulosicoccaceae bacterium]
MNLVTRLAVCLLALLPHVGHAGNFAVSPIRLDLGRSARTGSVTVKNNGEQPIQLQLNLTEWTQDEEGKDRYDDSADLIYFPKVMVLEKAEERIVRVGTRIPATDREKTYRLFIREIPQPNKPGGTKVSVAIRFGLPVFVSPIKSEYQGQIEQISLSGGALTARVSNTGNTHFLIQSVEIRSRDRLIRELPGWYLLAGAARDYKAEIKPAACKGLDELEVLVKTNKTTLRRGITVNPAMCEP